MDEFDEICRRCTPVVYRFLLSLCKDASLADELTAETFYQAYLHIGTFRGNCRVESWLCQIAKNALTKELRRQRRAVPFEETHELAAPDDIFIRGSHFLHQQGFCIRLFRIFQHNYRIGAARQHAAGGNCNGLARM